MIKIVLLIFSVLAFFDVGTIDISRIQTNSFDLTINSLYKIFSSIYIYLLFCGWLESFEPQIIKMLFIDWTDWALFKLLLVITNYVSILLTTGGFITVMISLLFGVLFPNISLFINFKFKNLLFEGIIVPLIQIIVNDIFFSESRNLTIGSKEKMMKTVILTTTIYFSVLLVMIHKHKLMI